MGEVEAACGALAVSIEVLGTRYDGLGRYTLSMITADYGHGVGLVLGLPDKVRTKDNWSPFFFSFVFDFG